MNILPFTFGILLTVYLFAMMWSLTRKDSDYGYVQKSTHSDNDTP